MWFLFLVYIICINSYNFLILLGFVKIKLKNEHNFLEEKLK